MKHCPKCDQDLSIDAFAPSQQKRPNVYCISCNRTYMHEYYRANKKKMNNQMRIYVEEHKEELRVYQQQYRASRPDMYEQRKSYYQGRYQENRDEIRKQQNTYQKRTPEIGARRTMRYYARKMGAEGTHAVADWRALRVWFGSHCLCCGTTKKLEADHVIPLDSGGSDDISNIQPLCRSCNASKATQTIDYRDPIQLGAFLASLPR